MNHRRPPPHVLDLSGKFCPDVVLAVRSYMESAPPDREICVWSTDPLSEIDIPLYAMRAGIDVVRRWREAESFRFILVRRSPAAT